MLNGVQIEIWNMAVEAEFALKYNEATRCERLDSRASW